MKKLFFVAVFAAGFVFTSQAQDISLGAKAGVNFASLNGDDSDGFDGRTNFHLGAILEVKFSEKFAFQPELLYSAQGASVSDIDIKLDYINLPLMLKFFVAEGLSLEAGPQIGFVINDELVGEDIDAESIDFGANFGLGYRLDNGFYFQGRYNLGLTDTFDGGDLQNGVFQLSVGYFFL
ncbi:porin family protein [Ascidiimonas aurantiaca]|uniref:porin family protein n=1 Tax=Ascidiimonas aurantiaca TaxID=1685432 RepID=UPI0030EDF84C